MRESKAAFPTLLSTSSLQARWSELQPGARSWQPSTIVVSGVAIELRNHVRRVCCPGSLRRSGVAALAGLLVAGCASATLVTPPGKPGTPNAPKGDARRPGIVRYSTEGLDSNVETRRSEAYDVMHRACGGEARIEAEGPRIYNGTVDTKEPPATDPPSNYWYIQFQCAAP